MLFCEDCRKKKKWLRSSGYPLIGLRQNEKCEICLRDMIECHDLPGSMAIPESDKTLEQKQIDKMMQQGYNQKAEELIIVNVEGREASKINYRLTEDLKKIKVDVNGETDWFVTFLLRQKAQQLIQRQLEIKRDRR